MLQHSRWANQDDDSAPEGTAAPARQLLVLWNHESVSLFLLLSENVSLEDQVANILLISFALDVW